MFSNWKQAYLLETYLQIAILLKTYIIMEVDYMFLYLELRKSSRNMSTDFSSVIYVYYQGNRLHVSLLGYTHIISEHVYRFLYS